MAEKADVDHGHDINLTVNMGSLKHSHTVEDITDLNDVLDAYATNEHSHKLEDLSPGVLKELPSVDAEEMFSLNSQGDEIVEGVVDGEWIKLTPINMDVNIQLKVSYRGRWIGLLKTEDCEVHKYIHISDGGNNEGYFEFADTGEIRV